jgi:hypothetical protein
VASWQLGLLIWLLFTVVCGFVAFGKDRSVALWVLLGFLFGAFALVVIALLPDRKKVQYLERKEPFVPVAAPTRPQTYGKCPNCGRIAFSANDSGDYYCYACGESVQVVLPTT